MARFSAHLGYLFTDRPLPERFAAAARCGFKACEFRFPFDHPAGDIAAWLHDAGLENVLFNMPAGDWARGERGIAALPGREAEFRQAVARSLDYARILGTRMLHVMAGMAGTHETFVSNLRYAAKEAAKDGIVVTIEPINPHDQPGYFLTHQAQAHAIREEVGEPTLKVQMDLYHVQMTEGDITAKIRRYLPQVAHIQIAGAPGRHEPDTGEVNYLHVFRVLDEAGYAGWVGCEYFPRARTEDGLAWMRQT